MPTTRYGMGTQPLSTKRMKDKIIKQFEKHHFTFVLNEYSNFPVTGISIIQKAQQGHVCFLDKNRPDIVAKKKNILLICPFDFPESNSSISYLKVSDPKLAFYYISHLFGSNSDFPIDQDLTDRFPGTVIGKNCSIGKNVVVHPNSVIRGNTTIHDNTVIESGCVIGGSGLLWTLNHRTNKKVMMTLTGGTIIGKNCYICGNVSIVRGACNEFTQIHDDVMIAPGTAVGHGCIIEENTHIGNNVTLGGAVKIGKNCFLGSASCIQPSVHLVENSVLAASATLTESVSTNGIFAGTPAKKIGELRTNMKGIPRTR